MEILDLVDRDDNIIDTKCRDEIYGRGLKYVRVVEGFVMNSQGKLWIPIRTADKKIAPNGFDVGVGGHVEHGETYLEAFRKETSEELGWNIDDLEYEKIGKFGPNEGLATMSMVYVIHSDKAPTFNPDDFSDAEWLTPQEVAQKIRQGHPAKSNLAHLLKHVYSVKI
ncbi:MAG TPA: NUDIX domain-containing protein [Patescibacteria group bacterium]|nr:NUDIX domain-containing protein [Patescibacteria group bacterium]